MKIKMPNYNKKTLFIVLVVVVLLALIGGGIYFYTQNGSTDTTKNDSSSTANNLSESAAKSGLTIKMLNGDLEIKAVDGWIKATEMNIFKSIDGNDYIISFQPQGQDYLKVDVLGGYATELSTVKTSQGTTLHILKYGKSQDATNVVVSTCAPVNGYGCAPNLDNRKMYIILAPVAGSATSRMSPLDYSLPSTDTAIKDFEEIAQSLPL